jgi:hypothetical protein
MQRLTPHDFFRDIGLALAAHADPHAAEIISLLT